VTTNKVPAVHAREQAATRATLARVFRRALLAALPLAAAIAPVASASDPITPLSDVHRGLHCTARTVVQGTTISTFDVDVLDVIAGVDGIDARILVRVSGPAVADTGVAEGFSGSPVYCPDAHGTIGNAGAISATVGQYGGDVALVTPIEQMLGVPAGSQPVHGTVSAPKLLRSARPLAMPLVISGLSPSFGERVERAARSHGRTVLATPAGPLGSFAPQPLVPGASVSVMLSKGAISAGGIGTITYRDGDTVYGFGHPFEDAGRRSLLLGDAYVFAVIGNPLDIPGAAVSYKLAAPGHVLGTLTDDAPAAVVGAVGAAPSTVPLTVTVRDQDTGKTLQQRTDVVDEADVGEPMGQSALSLIAPLAVAQAVTAAYDGAPARESGRMCLRMRVRETKTPLRFCNRYVLNGGVGLDSDTPLSLIAGLDVTSALQAISAAHFATLHVERVSVGIKIARGLQLASIVSAKAPPTAHAGKLLPIALRVRRERGPLQTLHFKLKVPHDIVDGVQPLVLRGSRLDIDGSDGDGFFSLLFGDFGSSSPPGAASSLKAMIHDVDAIGRYDGVNASFGLHPGRVHAFLDPNMRISGHAMLLVKVVGGKRPPHHGHGSHAAGSGQLGAGSNQISVGIHG
jgi:hypothetical protein